MNADDEITELKLSPGTVVKINGIPLKIATTTTVLTARGNLALLPREVVNHTVTCEVRAEENKKRKEDTHRLAIFFMFVILVSTLTLTAIYFITR